MLASYRQGLAHTHHKLRTIRKIRVRVRVRHMSCVSMLGQAKIPPFLLHKMLALALSDGAPLGLYLQRHL